MPMQPTRRRFLQTSGAISTTAVLSGVLGACTTTGTSSTSMHTTSAQLAMTASEAVEAIRSGSLSAETYVTTLLGRAEQLAALNSMITLNRAGAIAAARRVDAARASGATLPTLAGLPIVVKDNINTANLPTTGATPALKDLRPSANAPALQRLLDAGAIVLGKANMHELAFGTTSTNFTPFAGTVRNPYDRNRVPGGSSGGTGAAIAARIAPAGLGTDTGGSVRIPSALCGIAGLRPTVGNGGAQRRYDGSGVLPISHTRDTIGPMGRTVRDIALLDAAMAGAAIASSVPLAGLRIGVPASFWKDTETQVATVMLAAKARLQSAGVVFVDVDAPELWELNGKVSFQVVLHEAGRDIPAYLQATGTRITLADIAAQVASPDVKGPMGAVLADPTAPEYQAAITIHRPQMQAVYARYFAANRLDAMMFPTTSVAAPLIDAQHGSSKISVNGGPLVDTFATMIRNSDPGSNTGVPGLSLPAGLTASGLPVGLSLDGPMGSDSRLLGIGLSMESVLGVLPAPQLS
jgi:Asp-tRNA(Asn)/Glu-tRNA(Gln) amidotransferase A subunit family amidase